MWLGIARGEGCFAPRVQENWVTKAWVWGFFVKWEGPNTNPVSGYTGCGFLPRLNLVLQRWPPKQLPQLAKCVDNNDQPQQVWGCSWEQTQWYHHWKIQRSTKTRHPRPHDLKEVKTWVHQ